MQILRDAPKLYSRVEFSFVTGIPKNTLKDWNIRGVFKPAQDKKYTVEQISPAQALWNKNKHIPPPLSYHIKEAAKMSGYPVNTLKWLKRQGIIVPDVAGEFYSENKIAQLQARRGKSIKHKSKEVVTKDSVAVDSQAKAKADEANFAPKTVIKKEGDFKSKPFYPMDIEPQFDNIPVFMKDLDRWIPWCKEYVGEKLSKVPKKMSGGRLVNASAKDEKNFISFAEAIKIYQQGLCSGIGFCLTTQSPKIVCCDIDHCVSEDGSLSSLAQEIMEICSYSYTEFSQSGKGIHIFFIDEDFNGGRCRRGNIELYGLDRYIAMTGVTIDGAREIKTVNVTRSLRAKYISDDDLIKPQGEIKLDFTKHSALTDEDKKLIEYFRSDECKDSKMHYLFLGDKDNYVEIDKKLSDDSVADMSLCAKLFYYVGDFPPRVLAIFNESGLAKREKWACRADYRERTLEAAYKDWVKGGRETCNKPAQIKDFVHTTDIIPECPVDAQIPCNFILTPSKIAARTGKKKKNGEKVAIDVTAALTPMVVTKIFREDKSHTTSYEVAILTAGKIWRRIIVDGDVVQDSRKILSLAKLGGALIKSVAYIKDWFVEFIALNQQRLQEVKVYTKPGWRGDEFIYPPGSGDYIVRRAGLDYAQLFAVKGNQDAWITHFCEIVMSNVDCRWIFGFGLLAPLLKKLGLPNMHLHIEGRSDWAKSPMIKFVLSVFGNPSEGMLFRTFDSSPKNRVAMAVGLNDFPQGLDELESLSRFDEKELARSAYNFFSGIDGQKNKRNGDVREAQNFRGVRISSGERGYLKITDKRGAYKRVVPVRISAPLMTDSQAVSLHNFLTNNYGHFGRAWVEYISQHEDAIKADYEKLKLHFEENGFWRQGVKLKVDSIEPTHLRAVVASLVAFYHFVVWAGFSSDYDFDCLRLDIRYFLVTLPTQEEIDDVGRAIELLASYVNEHPRNFDAEKEDDETGKTVEIHALSFQGTDGKIFVDGSVGFYPGAFRRIVEDVLKLPSADKLLNELFDKNFLDCKSNREKSKQVWNKTERKNKRMYVVKAEVFGNKADNDADNADNATASAY